LFIILQTLTSGMWVTSKLATATIYKHQVTYTALYYVVFVLYIWWVLIIMIWLLKLKQQGPYLTDGLTCLMWWPNYCGKKDATPPISFFPQCSVIAVSSKKFYSQCLIAPHYWDCLNDKILWIKTLIYVILSQIIFFTEYLYTMTFEAGYLGYSHK